MWLLREKLSDFRENNLKTVQEWNKSYIELIALYVHPKKQQSSSTTIKSITALDYSRLGLENKFFPHEIGQSPTYTTFIL